MIEYIEPSDEDRFVFSKKFAHYLSHDAEGRPLQPNRENAHMVQYLRKGSAKKPPVLYQQQYRFSDEPRAMQTQGVVQPSGPRFDMNRHDNRRLSKKESPL